MGNRSGLASFLFWAFGKNVWAGTGIFLAIAIPLLHQARWSHSRERLLVRRFAGKAPKMPQRFGVYYGFGPACYDLDGFGQ